MQYYNWSPWSPRLVSNLFDHPSIHHWSVQNLLRTVKFLRTASTNASESLESIEFGSWITWILHKFPDPTHDPLLYFHLLHLSVWCLKPTPNLTSPPCESSSQDHLSFRALIFILSKNSHQVIKFSSLIFSQQLFNWLHESSQVDPTN